MREFRPDVPASLEAVVMRALEKDPARRYSSAKAMDEALAGLDLASDEGTALWTQAPTPEQMTVLLVDDHALVTQALEAMLGREPDIEVVGRASTVAEGIALARSTTPDVILLDYDLPDGDGVSAARQILAERPETKVVMLTATTTDLVLVEAIEAGCAGFVPKREAVEEVVAAVRAAHAGEAPISPELLARLLPQMRRASGRAVFDLTRRETQILRLLAEGLSNEAVADELELAVGTVRTHIQHVIKKVGARSKLEALAIATREGLVDLKRARRD
jgi:DNA-binding NarL/FixJ family response regulator